MSRRYKTTITNRNTLLFRYATKIRLQCWEKMLYIQWINNSVSLSLYLHIYSDVPWRRGGRVRCGGCEKMLHPLPLFRTVSDLCKIFLEKIPKCLSFGQSRFTQQSSCHFFLSDLSLWWQYKEILHCKHNHKFKHTNAA